MIDSLVETVVSKFQLMIDEKKHLTEIRYHFAIQCEQDRHKYKHTTPLNPYHKRHVLPNEALCHKCLVEMKSGRLLNSWNKALSKVSSI